MGVYIGTSGFSYQHWANGVFYPPGLASGKWLEFYAQHFSTVELNVSFYRLPSISTFRGWYRRVPAEFSFAVKGSRFITHIKRLNNVAEALTLFFERATELREKLAVVLWQLPPRFKRDEARLADFVSQLEHWKNIQQVFEFRDESWFCESILELLKKWGAAICIADWPPFAASAPITANFAYIRRHGSSGQLYSGCYSEEQLQADAQRITELLDQQQDVYIYFNNDSQGWAVQNALFLSKLFSHKSG